MFSTLAAFLLSAFPQADTGGKPVLKYDEFKIVADKNMFSPQKPKKVEKEKPKVEKDKPKEDKKPDPPKPPMVRGLVEMGGAYCALIEDTATKKSQFYKVGDSVAGGTIEAVDKLKVVIKFKDGTKEYHNGEALPVVGGTGTGGGTTKTEPAKTETPATEVDDKNLEDIKARLKKNRGKKVEDEDPEEEKPKSGIKK